MKKGFSLVELLIASAIFTVLMLALYSAFSTGITGYRNVQERIDSHNAARQILERINQDLRNCFKYSSSQTRFQGSANQLSFLTLVDTYDQAGMLREYAFVSYEFSGDKLKRLCRKGKESLKDSASVQPEEMAGLLEDLTFSYLYEDGSEIKEQDTWSNLRQLPLAVKVRLVIKNKRADEFARTIFCPKM